MIFYPAKQGGVSETFQHQNYNEVGAAEYAWREGRLCLDTGLRALSREAYDFEPLNPEQRLIWHVGRLQEWLKLASNGELVQSGDPFELPHVPVTENIRLAFSESNETLRQWMQLSQRYGSAQINVLSAESPYQVVAGFFVGEKREPIGTKWVKTLGQTFDNNSAWIRLDRLPVLQPWQIPISWGELRRACQAQEIKLNSLLHSAVNSLRDGRWHWLLIGFPIPARNWDPNQQMHWLALKLPPLASRPVPGFRPNREGYWRADLCKVFRDNTRLEWVQTENWHFKEVTNRGRLRTEVTTKSVLIIGCGALGSAISEILVRAGVQKLVLIDPDNLSVGNLSRHTLGISSLGKSKSSALANRLNQVAIHSSVQSIEESFPAKCQSNIDLMLACDVVIDCSGSDSVSYDLACFPWTESKTFFSISLGLEALRLFLFISHGETYPNQEFREQIDPWLELELEGYSAELPRDGIGCWHPRMPARADDVWLMAAVAMKAVENWIAFPPAKSRLTVYEQKLEDGVFTGLHEVLPSEHPV